NTGQVVTYQSQGGTPIGGLTDGHKYAVIVPVGPGIDSARSLQLGTIFDGATVDTSRDELKFAGAHNLSTGDRVYYFPAAGSTGIGGLISGHLYTVNVIDSTTIKLLDPALPAPSSSGNGGSVAVNGSGQGVASFSNTFAPNQPVTYNRPAP